MLTLRQILADKEAIIAGLEKKHMDNARECIESVIAIDQARKAAQQKKDNASAEMNTLSKSIGQLMAKGEREQAEQVKATTAQLKEDIRTYEAQMTQAEEQMRQALLTIPNVPYPIVPEGKHAEDNLAVKVGGWQIPEGLALLQQDNDHAFSADGNSIALRDWQDSFNPVHNEGMHPHWDLAKEYGLIDFDLGVKISGAGFPVYTAQGARLQRALIQFFLDEAGKAGYTEIMPPTVVNAASGYGTGQLPDKEGQMYHAELDDLYLIPTAEVPVTNLFRDEILDEKALPVKLCAYTQCFRREAGSYGKDVRGLNRLHEFSKIEIVRVDTPEHSAVSHREMLDHVEGLLQKLELPYRILRLCGGDMSFTAALCYDFEVYSLAQQRWLEVSSTSNFDTYQANRLHCRYRSQADKKVQLAHTLNGSALALPRIVAALLENNQTADGILLPKALRPYFGAEKISK